MATKIIVLSDGYTWETLNDCQQIWEITDEAYDLLADGDISLKSLRKTEILSISGVEEKSDV